MKISVFGLGYVGTVSAACLSQQGHEVIGVDINPQKVEIINNGHSPVIEHEIDDIVNVSVSAGYLRATTDAAEGVRNSDLSMICVGTPSRDNGSLDLTYVERVCNDIGHAIATKKRFHTVVLRSTVLPGTTKTTVIPALEQTSGLEAGQDFGLCHTPEFLREGTSVKDFYNPPFTVIGELDSRGAEITTSLFQNLDAPIITVSLETAEMVKYASNAFHALKVVFANEIGNICKSQGIDSHQVMDIFCKDDKLNLSPYYLKPGFAFGGSCLPKDLRALLYQGRRQDLRLPVLEAILPSNELQIRRGIEMVRQTGFKKVGVLGFSFKAGTDDLRESPMVGMIEFLLGKGYDIKIYDRNVSLARLHGANRAFIEREIPHIASLMRDSIEDVVSTSEVIVIGNKSSEFSQVFQQADPNQLIIDLVRISENGDRSNAQYEGICW
jgi:GDP-mannose 6-dehydrogenase